MVENTPMGMSMGKGTGRWSEPLPGAPSRRSPARPRSRCVPGDLAHLVPSLLLALLLQPLPLLPAGGQEGLPPTGWELTGIPALNYDSDEGFGYGAVLALYDYGPGGMLPYRMAFHPTLFLTTKGRRDLSLFFDAPHLVPGWRLDGYLALERQIATPYYGLGNDSPYEPELEEGENPYFYRFGRQGVTVRANLQRPLGAWPLRLLFGFRLSGLEIDATPKDEGTTLLQEELGPLGDLPDGADHSLRVGLVWDTRDRESGPSRGAWTEALLERADQRLGGAHSYTRITLTDRRYVTLARGLVLAYRIILQNAFGAPPFHRLSDIQSSFEGLEGLGGAKSVRGVLRNRYIGKGLAIWNVELRWRARDFRFLGREAHLALIAFLDSGRVWAGGIALSSVVADLHHGGGGGLRIGLGPNFVVAADLAHTREAGVQTYIGLGYLF